MSNPGNVSGGHKANLNNPHTSEESKQHSRQVLDGEYDDEYDGGETNSRASNYQAGDTEGKNPNNVAGGYKATLKNPNVSDEAKQHAQEQLDQMQK